MGKCNVTVGSAISPRGVSDVGDDVVEELFVFGSRRARVSCLGSP
jgi:hypothetical protein